MNEYGGLKAVENTALLSLFEKYTLSQIPVSHPNIADNVMFHPLSPKFSLHKNAAADYLIFVFIYLNRK